MTAVHVVLPGDIDDPADPSGGNAYDRHVCRGLAGRGWTVREHQVPGGWPHPGPRERADLAGLLGGLPDGVPVLLDGLVASTVPDVLAPHAARLRLVILVHLPIEGETEARSLAAATAVVATSEWTRDRLLDRYRLSPGRVTVAPPGVDPAPVASGTPGGGRLLCVAAVTPVKGHDVLAAALTEVADLDWTCDWVGPPDRDRAFADRLRARLTATGLGGRVRLTGPRTGPDLAATYAATDLLVAPSRRETYGMVVTEALARGVPVLASDTGGLPDTLGHAPGGDRPGLLVPPGDPGATAAALRRWLTDPGLRDRLRRAARQRRHTLTGWPVTVDRLATALKEATEA
ncbi:glycosyltransferase family 4 protein [Micromonospora tulbaghiae]|uniref:Glycosyl transferases group 1 n=1 Tax=Micromonospora tulbaghiae TaxID=479978 RepID=A0AAW4JFF6_9ACTN|nr:MULTISPECIES: glycosyltransferase family 4 protein [Micromonospora]KAB1907119.1 glycosyltransferase family 4 protein [Micromonospora sp. AMSO1212t]MBO4138765.1 glycosyltransferase family 4 protein [Micromonospora tulbaghiae]MDX5458192.1 glycosyltransferase family 4 protein [Micromonospora tulbaghiae]SCE76025.1 Glycosyl transferases group 1 [Micromonospora tulbaghiae]